MNIVSHVYVMQDVEVTGIWGESILKNPVEMLMGLGNCRQPC